MNDKNKKNSFIAFISLIIGIISIILIINWFEIYPNFLPFVIGMIAIIFGYIGKKDGNKYGQVGLVLGIISTILGALQIVAWFIYDYIASLV